jgi:hypothetical protein
MFTFSRCLTPAAFAPSSDIANINSRSIDNGVIINTTTVDNIDTSDIIPDIKEAIDNTTQFVFRKINEFSLSK